ncbi:MAG: 3-dehydroquinate synthase, partial [Planctomycetota bacterium]
GLPVTLPDGLTPSAVARRAGVDKKRRGGKLRMVLPRTRTPAVVREVSESELLDALRATKG